MTSKKFCVDDYYELIALHRALLESQFCDEANDMDVSASPIVAKLHKQLLEILVEVEVEKKGPKVKMAWDDWLKIDVDRREWKIALARAKEERLWSEWGHDERKKYAHDLLSPFELSDDLAEKFIKLIG